jgi:radical SAM superfamily enzyme YgiQ (UPF0313 family)
VNPLKIYLGDLTYTTVTLSTEAMPLNIGYIAANCKALHGDSVDIQLFKYISDLEKALNADEPDILGLSNYCWSEHISLEFFRILRKKNPNGITVWGGPNIPTKNDDQIVFLKNRPDVDVYVPTEGEIGFSNLVTRILSTRTTSIIDKSKLFVTAIDGCIVDDQKGNYLVGKVVSRIKELDQIPSPYLTGILDKFFDKRLKPAMQTNRGCPFTCTFCVDGSHLVNKINKFSLERIRKELLYIAKKSKNNMATQDLWLMDLNFGMYSRDIEICKFIRECQLEFGYPSNVSTTTGKNSKEKIATAVKVLDGALRMTMSVQSMDDRVLENIGRKNISTSKMLDVMKKVDDADLKTTSEVIMGLPGDSFDSCLRTVEILFNAGIDHIQMYTLMLLPGSELNTKSQRDKWGFTTKWRLLPRDFVQLENGNRILEVEEVVVASKTLDFQDYLNLREIALIIWVVSHGILFDPVRKLLSSYEINTFDLIMHMYKCRYDYDDSIADIFRSFRESTNSELWDGPQELTDNYQCDSEWEKLLNGDAGNNIIQYFHYRILSEVLVTWVKYTVESVREVLRNAGIYDDDVSNVVDAIEKLCLSVSYKVLELDRPLSIVNRFDFDIVGWLTAKDNVQLHHWKVEKPLDFEFVLTEDQYRRVEDEMSIYGDTNSGRSQAVKRTNVHDLWRKPTASM